MPITDLLIQRAAAADTDALCELDARGLMPAPGEAPATFAARLEKLRADLAEVEAELAKTGRFQIESEEFPAADRIPAELFADAHARTEELFAFRADWVPGFYVNPRFSWLFGGCAYSCHPDLFTVFIIRRSFAVRDRWFLYSRRELLAHELSHVARTSLDSICFEERFAYLTSESGFRRRIGGAFYKPSDTFLLLGSLFLLLGAQLARVFFWEPLPVWPFWCAAFGVIAGLIQRHVRDGRRLERALARLAARFGANARAALFRCSDAEIAELAELPDDNALAPWLARRTNDLRWQVIENRFAPAPPSAAAP